MVEDLEIW